MVDRKRWEYKRIACPAFDWEGQFNEAGLNGWELVSVFSEELSNEETNSPVHRVVGYFKRDL